MTLRSTTAYFFCLMLSGIAVADNDELAGFSLYYLGDTERGQRVLAQITTGYLNLRMLKTLSAARHFDRQDYNGLRRWEKPAICE